MHSEPQTRDPNALLRPKQNLGSKYQGLTDRASNSRQPMSDTAADTITFNNLISFSIGRHAPGCGLCDRQCDRLLCACPSNDDLSQAQVSTYIDTFSGQSLVRMEGRSITSSASLSLRGLHPGEAERYGTFAHAYPDGCTGPDRSQCDCLQPVA